MTHPKTKTWHREIEFIRDPDPIPPTQQFLDDCQSFGIELSQPELEKLSAFLALLLANNQRVNMTAITDHTQAWHKHIFDALTLLSVLADLPQTARIADVGSGGGLPAIPLAIALPNLHFTLIESTGKKAQFIQMAANAINLTNTTVLTARAESLGQDKHHRAKYHAVTARAVGPLATVAELTIPLAQVGAIAVLTKGQRSEEELARAKPALHTLCVRHETTFQTPTGRLIILAKDRPTPALYPRRDGEPKRNPLH